MLKTSEFNFELPENLIAHQPFFPKEETADWHQDNFSENSTIAHNIASDKLKRLGQHQNLTFL